MRLLMISNSTNPGEGYLEYPLKDIADFLGEKPLNIIFVPFAAVSFSFDEYAEKVNRRLQEIGQKATSIHRCEQPLKAVAECDAIIVGGGNTFQLIKMIQEQGLLQAIREKVRQGAPYIGWSAGSNVCCPSIRTTNDMPIVEPKSFEAFGFVPFQINPHYLDARLKDHGGETREERIIEFINANKNMPVLGLRERCMLRLERNKLSLIGPFSVRCFKHGEAVKELDKSFNFSSFLSADTFLDDKR